MGEKPVLMEMKERICVLTLNEPDRLNAMSSDMAALFKETIERLKENPEPRVLIVTGAGRAFSAGGNLQRIAASFGMDPGKRKKQSFDFYNSFLSVRTLRIPTIAAINGYAIGAGACLATACNMRMAAESAKIGFTFTRIGLHPGMGAEYLLLNTVGEAKTYELLMTGDIIPAAEALRIGLVNHVVPDEELMDRALALAGKIRTKPDLPIKMLKDSIPAASTGTLEETLHRQASYQAINYMTKDFKEGITALIKKRKPRFQEDY
jgi:enoyl-CoA hydratase